MDTKETVKQRQLTILEGLIRWEMLCAKLYTVYGALFGENREFWDGLATDEKKHAKMLGSLTNYVNHGHVLWNLGYFDEKGIAPMLDVVNEAIDGAEGEECTEGEALQTACHVEASIVESKLYSYLKTDAPGFPELSTSLAQEEEEHLDRLRSRYHEHLT